MRIAAILTSAALAVLPATTALAQPGGHQGHGGMQGMNHDQMMSGMDPAMMGGPAGREYMQAMMSMHQRMMAVHDRDPARYWALMMIEHHQGAIDTSRIALRNTNDAQARRLAQQTIDENTRSQAELRRWLNARRGS